MARTIFGVGDPKAVKKWSGALSYDASQKSYFQPRFMGRGETAETPIQIHTDLEADAGEQITYDLLAEMRMAPVEGEDTLEGKEEAQRYFTDQIWIDQARCGVNTGGRMTRKRTLHKLREKAKMQQSSWWGRFQDELLFVYGAGLRGVNDNFIIPAVYSGRANNPLQAIDTAHMVYPGAVTAFNNLTSGDKMGLVTIDKAVVRAQTQGGGATDIPVLQPCKLDGAECYVLVMHTWQEDDLRKETGEAGWLQIQKAAAGAEGRASSLFKNALGMYRGVVLHSHRNVIRYSNAGAGANVAGARALFMGAQAMVVAFGSPGTGMRFQWNEETRDNGDKVVITSSSIFGCKATQFTIGGTSQRFGMFAIDAAAAAR
jgi:N4-gp56 family major capsid protein